MINLPAVAKLLVALGTFFATVATIQCGSPSGGQRPADRNETTLHPSSVETASTGTWVCKVKQLPANVRLDFAKFFDETRWKGFSSDGESYRFDGHRASVTLPVPISRIPIPRKSYIAELVFASDTHGWIIALRYGEGLPMESSVLATVDGGLTWTTQMAKVDVEFTKISFWGESDGWLVGRTSSARFSEVSRPVLYSTSDGGRSWQERPISFGEGKSVGFDDVVAESATRALILTSSKGIYRVSTAYPDAEQVTELKDVEHPSIANMEVLSDGGIGLVGGTDSKEGVWGVVALYSGAWNTFKIPNVNIKSGVFLSKTELMVSGYRVASDARTRENEPSTPLILYSNSGGKTFAPICGLKSDAILTLTQIGNGLILGFGGNQIVTIKRNNN